MDQKIISLIQSPTTDIRVGSWITVNGQFEGTLDLFQNGKMIATLLTALDVFESEEEAIEAMNIILHKITQKAGGT
jgi:hypothetical protein